MQSSIEFRLAYPKLEGYNYSINKHIEKKIKNIFIFIYIYFKKDIYMKNLLDLCNSGYLTYITTIFFFITSNND